MLASTLLGEGLRDVISNKAGVASPAPETPAPDLIGQVLATGQIVKREDKLTGRSGNTIWLDSTFMPLYNEAGTAYAVLGVSHDITERKKMETQIAASLQEKDYLLKEIHHRVKNNLQVISSLLSMQARKATDINVKQTLTESQNRVKSIALVHEKLYQSRSLDRIEYGDYLNKVVNHLFESFNVNPAQISWKVNAKEVDVNIEQAVPCSLILNEMITNSLKYAFPQGRKGEITISFTLADNNYTLDYRDNGVGVPEGAHLERAGSLGMQLIHGLTRQLDGKVTIDTTSGVHYTIIFPQKQKGEVIP
jgi:two-component sensor histidine kinase